MGKDKESEEEKLTEEQVEAFEEAEETVTAHAQVPAGFDAGNPDHRLYFVAFDGTWKTDQDANLSNPAKLRPLVENAGHTNVITAYVSGVGTDGGAVNKYLTGGALGEGTVQKADKAYNAFSEQVYVWREDNPNAEIHVSTAGFSRGTGSERHFLNKLYYEGIPVEDATKIQTDEVIGYTGQGGRASEPIYKVVYDGYVIPPGEILVDGVLIYDSVITGQESRIDTAMPPIPGMRVLHLTADNEYRDQFDLNSVIDPDNPGDPRLLEIGLPGAHSDIGGGRGDNGIEALTLPPAGGNSSQASRQRWFPIGALSHDGGSWFDAMSFTIRVLFFLCLGVLMSGCSERPFYFEKQSGVLRNLRKVSVESPNGASFALFRPRSNQILVSSRSARDITILDIDTGEVVGSFPRRDKAAGIHVVVSKLNANDSSIRYTPDGRYMVAMYVPKGEERAKAKAGDKSIPSYYLIDADTYEIVRKVGDGYTRFPFGITPDGRYLYAANYTQKLKDSPHPADAPILSLIDTRTWEVVKRVYWGDAVDYVDATPDSRYLLDYAYPGMEHPVYLEDYPVIRVWRLPDLELVRELGPVFKGQSDATVIAARGGRHVYVIDTEYTVVGKRTIDGGHLLFEGKEYAEENIGEFLWQGARKIDLETGEVVNELAMHNWAQAQISHNDRYIFAKGYVDDSKGRDQNIEIYDERTGELVEELVFPEARWALALAMSPDGRRFAAAYERDVWIWDIESGD